MATPITITEQDTRVDYQVGGTADDTFDIPFEFFESSDIRVSVGGVEQTSGFTVTGTSVQGGFSDGTLTLDSAVSDTTVSIWRDIPLSRTSVFPTSGEFSITSLNTQLARIVAMIQQEAQTFLRALRLPEPESGKTNVLPARSDRADRVLAFDSDGQPVPKQVADLDTAIDTDITSIADGEYLRWNAAEQVWKNVTPAASDATYTPNYPGASTVNLRDELDRRALTVDAVADGSTRVTSEIQKVLDAAGNQGGGVVVLPARGTYVVHDNDADGFCLVVPANVTFVIDNGATLKLDDDQNDVGVIQISGNDAHVTGFGIIDGNRSNLTSGTIENYGVVGVQTNRWNSVSNLTIRNVYGRCVSSCFGSTGAEHFGVHNVRIENNGHKGIHIRGTKHAVVTNNVVEINGVVDNEADSGIESSMSEHVSISGNTVNHQTATNGPGIRLANNSRFVTVSGNSVFEGQHNYFVGDSNNIVIDGNLGVNGDKTGILVTHTDADNNGDGPPENIIISNNIFYNPDGTGCLIQVNDNTGKNGTNVNDVLIYGNLFFDANVNVMDFGIRMNENTGTITAQHWGNRIINAQTEDIRGTQNLIPLRAGPQDQVYSGTVEIADDDVHSITVPVTDARGIFRITLNATADSAEAAFRSNAAPLVTEAWNTNPSVIVFTTGVLTGTTGTNGDVTIGVDDNVIYIENRNGQSRSFAWLFSTLVGP
jgi:hypothetical protein